MLDEPQIAALPKKHRTFFFWSLVLVFVCALPAVIFYTTGYRLSFENDETSIVTTGGIYIDTENTDVEVYLDEEQITRPRLFRSAYYLQNIAAGKHRVVVQANGVHTWVKELPVDPHIVIEAAAFNIPTIPQLRPITRFQTTNGSSVYRGVDATVSTSTIFRDATTTEPFLFATSTATSTYTVNPEFEFVMQLFASSSSSTISVFAGNEPQPRFTFAKESEVTTATTTEVITERGDIRIEDRGWEIYALWQGQENNVPHYFCVSSSTKATTSERYGSHVADQVFDALATTTATSTVFTLDDRTCRTEIKLDHLRQDVYAYYFFPGASDLVLLHLEEGLYVTEIDDRGWQNTQQLLGGDDFLMLVENDVIYIKRDGYYFEVIPELET